MTTAKDKVFSTVELLETILLEVNDMQTLLLSQRVNKTFKNTIDGSINLQRALWFKPRLSDPEMSLAKESENPLIKTFKSKLGVRAIRLAKGHNLSIDTWFVEHDVAYIRFESMPVQEGSWRFMIPYHPELEPKHWLLAHYDGKTSLRGVDIWDITWQAEGGRMCCVGPHFNLGPQAQAPTMGEMVDSVKRWLKG